MMLGIFPQEVITVINKVLLSDQCFSYMYLYNIFINICEDVLLSILEKQLFCKFGDWKIGNFVQNHGKINSTLVHRVLLTFY
jgi:hypothetical protein